MRSEINEKKKKMHLMPQEIIQNWYMNCGTILCAGRESESQVYRKTIFFNFDPNKSDLWDQSEWKMPFKASIASEQHD